MGLSTHEEEDKSERDDHTIPATLREAGLPRIQFSNWATFKDTEVARKNENKFKLKPQLKKASKKTYLFKRQANFVNLLPSPSFPVCTHCTWQLSTPRYSPPYSRHSNLVAR